MGIWYCWIFLVLLFDHLAKESVDAHLVGVAAAVSTDDVTMTSGTFSRHERPLVFNNVTWTILQNCDFNMTCETFVTSFPSDATVVLISLRGTANIGRAHGLLCLRVTLFDNNMMTTTTAEDNISGVSEFMEQRPPEGIPVEPLLEDFWVNVPNEARTADHLRLEFINCDPQRILLVRREITVQVQSPGLIVVDEGRTQRIPILPLETRAFRVEFESGYPPDHGAIVASACNASILFDNNNNGANAQLLFMIVFIPMDASETTSTRSLPYTRQWGRLGMTCEDRTAMHIVKDPTARVLQNRTTRLCPRASFGLRTGSLFADQIVYILLYHRPTTLSYFQRDTLTTATTTTPLSATVQWAPWDIANWMSSTDMLPFRSQATSADMFLAEHHGPKEFGISWHDVALVRIPSRLLPSGMLSVSDALGSVCLIEDVLTSSLVELRVHYRYATAAAVDTPLTNMGEHDQRLEDNKEDGGGVIVATEFLFTSNLSEKVVMARLCNGFVAAVVELQPNKIPLLPWSDVPSPQAPFYLKEVVFAAIGVCLSMNFGCLFYYYIRSQKQDAAFHAALLSDPPTLNV